MQYLIFCMIELNIGCGMALSELQCVHERASLAFFEPRYGDIIRL
jgi:hypothetical protein